MLKKNNLNQATDAKEFGAGNPPPPILKFDHVGSSKELDNLVQWIIDFPCKAAQGNWILDYGENILLGAIMFYVWNNAPEEEQGLGVTQIMLAEIKPEIHCGGKVSPIDLMFEGWNNGKRNLSAIYSWREFRKLDSSIQTVIIDRLQARINGIKKYI